MLIFRHKLQRILYHKTSKPNTTDSQNAMHLKESLRIFLNTSDTTKHNLCLFTSYIIGFSEFNRHLFKFTSWMLSSMFQSTAASSGWLKSCISSSSLSRTVSFTNSWGIWDPKTLSSSTSALFSRLWSISASSTSWESTAHKNWY